jgi:HD-like signal output (HDOD) protein
MIARAILLDAPIEMVEWNLLGVGHAEIGQQMAEFWRLPDHLYETIGTHEGPFEGDESPVQFCVHIADNISKHLYYVGQKKLTFVLDPHAEKWLGFTAEDFEEVGTLLQEQMNESSDWLHQMAA